MSELFYVRPDAKLSDISGSAINDDRAFEETVFWCLPDSLQDAYLEVLFSAPSDIREPTAKDVDGVYIVDWAHVILGGRTDVSGSTQAELLAVIDELVDEITTDSMYNVVIERKQNESITQKKISIDGQHLLQAISYGFVEAVEEHDLDYLVSYYDSVDSAVRDCMTERKPITIKVKDIEYKLISAEEISAAA